MMLLLSQLVTACACFVGFGLLPVGTLGFLAAWDQVLHRDRLHLRRSAAFSRRPSSVVWIVIYMHQGMSLGDDGPAIEEARASCAYASAPTAS
jgi:hypothetical protein